MPNFTRTLHSVVRLLLLSILVLPATAAATEDGSGLERSFGFQIETEGWLPFVADLPLDADLEIYELLLGWRPLPSDLDGAGLYSQGHNRSSDLWLGWKARVEGLVPNTTYDIDWNLVLASNIPGGMVGIGGAPGESVFVKVGAATVEPVAVLDDDGWLRLNVDKGNQSQGGADAVVIGSVANPELDPENADGSTFALMELSGIGVGSTGTTDADGDLWLFVGTDSGFEGLTTLYYDAIEVALAPHA